MKRQLKDFNFLNDLNQRINPEKSRNFNREDLLKKISRLMETGNQDPFKTPEGTLRFGIIGSNGKGSTSQILSFYLNNSLPGLYTSPHLKSVTERIQIQNQNLDHEEFNALYFEMLHILKEDHYSYFEILTILSMYIFNLKKCKYQIYEAGIGGRFDATRMARPQAVILTGISLEHTQILGNSLSEILDEKLALLGGYTKHFFYPAYLDPILPGIIDRVHIINPQITIHPFHMNPELLKQNYLKFNDFYAGFILKEMEIPGAYHKMGINSEFKVRGRMEKYSSIVNGRNIEWIYDIAHNPEAIELLFYNLKTKTDLSRTAVFAGFLPDKNNESCFQIIKQFKPALLYQITGDDFHSKKILDQYISLKDIENELRKLLENHRIQSILMTGSSRLYEYFFYFAGNHSKTIHQKEI